MMYRSMRYFTRPMLVAADRERREAGIMSRHEHPKWTELSKKDRYVVVMTYPFLRGLGDRIPQALVVLQWAEGGMQWKMDVTIDRLRRLPKMTVENPHIYWFA
jgi:hypothetical protein